MMILITGASGFLGSALAQYLSNTYQVRALVTALPSIVIPNINYTSGFDLGRECNMSDALEGVQTLVHCAARLHVMQETTRNPVEEYRRINVLGTMNLATQAAKVGVKRFIYLSTIKVNGEATEIGQSFTPEDMPAPLDPYGISKLEVELALQDLASKTGMELVIIRPPLIYGPGVKANFASLIRLVKLGIPLPFGLANENRRSFVALENILNFIELCIQHPKAANQIFLISDNQDLSTSELLRELSNALEVRLCLFALPVSLLRLVAKIFKKSQVIERLLGSLQVDITKSMELLGWRPVITVSEGFRQLKQYQKK